MPSNVLCSEHRATAYVKNYLQKSDDCFYLLCDYIAACIVLLLVLYCCMYSIAACIVLLHV